jgi:hypothetical protein
VGALAEIGFFCYPGLVTFGVMPLVRAMVCWIGVCAGYISGGATRRKKNSTGARRLWYVVCCTFCLRLFPFLHSPR